MLKHPGEERPSIQSMAERGADAYSSLNYPVHTTNSSAVKAKNSAFSNDMSQSQSQSRRSGRNVGYPPGNRGRTVLSQVDSSVQVVSPPSAVEHVYKPTDSEMMETPSRNNNTGTFGGDILGEALKIIEAEAGHISICSSSARYHPNAEELAYAGEVQYPMNELEE